MYNGILQRGESFDIDSNDERLATGRIVLSTDDGSITINSIKRSQGNPSYKGNVELALYDEGIAVINEIDIEDYLKKLCLAKCLCHLALMP